MSGLPRLQRSTTVQAERACPACSMDANENILLIRLKSIGDIVFTLPAVSTFDDKGLWKYQEVCFSSHGNLKQTAVWLVQQAPRGLDSQELGGLVGLSARSSYLSRLRGLPGLSREWLDGKWVYLAGDEADRRRQWVERSVWAGRAAGLPTNPEAVDVLVCFIRHPELGSEELAQQLARQGRGVAAAKIENLLQRHGLLKRKLRATGPPLP